MQSSRSKVVRLRQEYQAMTTSSLGIYSEGRTANRICQRITYRIQKRRRVKNDPNAFVMRNLAKSFALSAVVNNG